MLSKSLRNSDYDLKQLNNTQVTKEMLENLSVYQTDPVALFYQTGYLTIKRYDPATQLYTLGYPNRETEIGIDFIRRYFSKKTASISSCKIEIEKRG